MGPVHIAGASSLEFGVGHAFFGLKNTYINTIWPVWALGISRSLSGLFATVSFWFSGKVINRLKPLKTAYASGIWSTATCLVGLVKATVISPIFLTLSSLSFGSSTVSQTVLLQEEFNEEQRATLGSISSMIGSIVFTLAAIGIGYLADIMGPRKALLVALVPGLIATLWFLKLSKQDRKIKTATNHTDGF